MTQAQDSPNSAAKIAPVVHKFTLGEQPTDFAYWQTQPYAARIAALEEIRRAYIAWKYGDDPGFQRVCTIVRR
jgi:hypothetical protein